VDNTTEAGAQAPPVPPWFQLAVGIMAASCSAILIRYAGDAEALAISFWRCAGGALLLAPYARRRVRDMRPFDYRLPLVAGAFLAVHFATWITSLELTTVAASVLLVSTTPVFSAVAGRFLFDERLPGGAWAGIALALAGTALLSGGDVVAGSAAGDALALAGGAAAAGYVMAGQRARRDLGVIEYAAVTYAVSAALLLAACVAGRVPLYGYDGRTWAAVVAIVAGPQLLGHTLINSVLKNIDATTVAVAVMVEPVVTILLAFVLLGEIPSLLVYPAGVAILGGIGLVSQVRRSGAEVTAT
jgi:drug/metabolite transporter (DMT)-like permease